MADSGSELVITTSNRQQKNLWIRHTQKQSKYIPEQSINKHLSSQQLVFKTSTTMAAAVAVSILSGEGAFFAVFSD